MSNYLSIELLIDVPVLHLADIQLLPSKPQNDSLVPPKPIESNCTCLLQLLWSCWKPISKQDMQVCRLGNWYPFLVWQLKTSLLTCISSSSVTWEQQGQDSWRCSQIPPVIPRSWKMPQILISHSYKVNLCCLFMPFLLCLKQCSLFCSVFFCVIFLHAAHHASLFLFFY